MRNNKVIQFVQSLVLLPLITAGLPMGTSNSIPDAIDSVKTPQVVFTQKLNIGASLLSFNQDKDEEALAKQILALKAQAIDDYYESRGMPLAGFGEKMVIEAEKNGLDWRLLAAISVRESTGGKFKCSKATFSSFGWGSCKINFDSHDEEIEIVALNLGGNNPSTARHYTGKTTKGILQAYNPPSIVPRYAQQVMSIMDAIGPAEIEHTETLASL